MLPLLAEDGVLRWPPKPAKRRPSGARIAPFESGTESSSSSFVVHSLKQTQKPAPAPRILPPTGTILGGRKSSTSLAWVEDDTLAAAGTRTAPRTDSLSTVELDDAGDETPPSQPQRLARRSSAGLATGVTYTSPVSPDASKTFPEWIHSNDQPVYLGAKSRAIPGESERAILQSRGSDEVVQVSPSHPWRERRASSLVKPASPDSLRCVLFLLKSHNGSTQYSHAGFR